MKCARNVCRRRFAAPSKWQIRLSRCAVALLVAFAVGGILMILVKGRDGPDVILDAAPALELPARQSPVPFTLGQLGQAGSHDVTVCKRSNTSSTNIICSLPHACWSAKTPGDLTVFSRDTDANLLRSVSGKFHVKQRDEVRPAGVVVLVDGATVMVPFFQDHVC